MARPVRATPGRWLDVGPVVLVTVALRLPVVVARAPVNIDDSVYLASVGAMRAGGAPFRDVYSSQGPAFLPMLRVADLVGGQTLWSPRLLPLAAAVALVVLVHRLGLRASDRIGAALAAALVATSGCVLFATSRLKSDGVAAALATAAILAAAGSRRRRTDVLTGLLLGVGLAVKSVFLGPAALAVALLLFRRRGWRAVAAAAATSAAAVLALSLPWGLADVWDQYVGFHLTARGSGSIGDNVDSLRTIVRHWDRLLLVVAATALAAVGVRWAMGRSTAREDDGVALALWIWLAASVVVLLASDPLFLQHLALVVPPVALLIARHRPPLLVIAAVVVLLLPGHADRSGWRVSRIEPVPSAQAAIEQLRGLTPADGLVISDEPAIPWLAGRTSPGSMVDVGFVRIEAGDLTTADVVAAATEPDVCAVLFWTGRLDALPGLREQLPDFQSAFVDGQHELLLRNGCTLAPR